MLFKEIHVDLQWSPEDIKEGTMYRFFNILNYLLKRS